MFLGEFEHALDAKQRLAIPAELRARWNPDVHGEGLVAMPGPNGLLWLWPAKTFQSQVSEEFKKFLRDPELVHLQSMVFSQCADLPFDSAGRVRIPDRLLEAYELKGRVVILGAFDHLQVVAPAKRLERGITPQDAGQAYAAILQKRADAQARSSG